MSKFQIERIKNIAVFADTFHFKDKDVDENRKLVVDASTFYFNMGAHADKAEDYVNGGEYYDTSISVQDERSIESAFNLIDRLGGNEKVGVLSFANCITPGGGVLKGAPGQEESICRISNLYHALPKFTTAYYEQNRSGTMAALIEAAFSFSDRKTAQYLGKDVECFRVEQYSRNYFAGSDGIIYTPDCLCFKSDTKSPKLLPKEQWKKVDILTCAAPNNRRYIFSDNGIGSIKKERAEYILKCFYENRIRNVILGAFGCGAFKNNPYVVSQAWKDAIENMRKKDLCLKILYSRRPSRKLCKPP